MPNYKQSKTMRVVRTEHVVTLFERDSAGTIIEVLRRVPPKARITDMTFEADDTGLRIEFVEETESSIESGVDSGKD